MSVEKILPLANSPTETYQGQAFVLSVLLAHNNVLNEYYNRYINLSCNESNRIDQMELNFCGTAWEDFRLSGIVEMDLYNVKNLSKSKFVNFTRERIDQGNYLLFYNIDEYYLSYSQYYCQEHYIHDAYVYGYKEDSFMVVAYNNKKLMKNIVPVGEIVEGLFCYEDESEAFDFCTFRPNQACYVTIEPEKMIEELELYFHSQNTEKESEKIYGLAVYDVFISCVKEIISMNDRETIELDMRPFRLLWEHKKILKDHIAKISDMISLSDNLQVQSEEVEKITRRIYMLILKWAFKRDFRLFWRILECLESVKEKEKLLVGDLLEEMKSAKV